ncbi:hypothetical protein K525DRAFT_195288 [Schizophyllum commune Loenen D]|nr:hypothetical protein K525DRAFT_195288 [Schizophyllum commune Loenen D]
MPDGEQLICVGVVLGEQGTIPCHWSHVSCDVQVGADADDMQDVLQQLHSGAASVFYTQETRMHHIGIAFAGDLFQLAYYDRAGCVLSGVHNIHKNPALLVRVVMGLSFLDSSYLGKDPSIISRDDHEYITVAGVEYEIMKMVACSGDILSKGTICWRCRSPGSKEQFVIKSKWTSIDRRTTEADFLRKARGVDGVGPERLAILKNHPRMQLRRLVLQPCGRSLQDFACKDELVGGFNDSIRAHHRLYEKRLILHCDISDNNVMLRDTDAPTGRRGLLVDLDCAIFVEGLDRLGPRGYNKGTPPFMACSLLNPYFDDERGPWHDLESFLYVFMYICATCSGPSKTPRKDFDIEDSPMGPWFTGDHRKKRRIMFDYDDAQFRAFLDELFDPYFDDLKNLVCDLRRVITRDPPFRPSHYAVLDVFEEYMDARAAAREREASVVPQKEDSPSAGPPTGSKRKHTSRDESPPPPSGHKADGAVSARSSQSSSSRASDDLHDASPPSDDSERTMVTSQDGLEKSGEEVSKESLDAVKPELSPRPISHPLKRRRVE